MKLLKQGKRLLGKLKKNKVLFQEEILNSKLLAIKKIYEEASSSGTTETLSKIRASQLIMLIHEYLKEELISQGINPKKIYPPLRSSSPEIKMIGFLKGKNQDITILPKDLSPEIIEDGVMLGETDEVGKELTNISLSINVRSQLSSLAKNFDTLYERTFAEALNLHLRCPKLVMGELYIVPVVAYDPDKRGNKGKIKFREILPALKYISSFAALNRRAVGELGEAYKYERVCLLIIDFRQEKPEIINDVKQLVEKNIITEEMAKKISLERLTISDFISDLLKIYEERHGSLDPLM